LQQIKNPDGVTIFQRFGDAEGQYEVTPTYEFVHGWRSMGFGLTVGLIASAATRAFMSCALSTATRTGSS
jgi:hypothetical protein